MLLTVTMTLTEAHVDLLSRARQAFRTDPSYAITMAQQAHALKARRGAKKKVEHIEGSHLEQSALSA